MLFPRSPEKRLPEYIQLFVKLTWAYSGGLQCIVYVFNHTATWCTKQRNLLFALICDEEISIAFLLQWLCGILISRLTWISIWRICTREDIVLVVTETTCLITSLPTNEIRSDFHHGVCIYLYSFPFLGRR